MLYPSAQDPDSVTAEAEVRAGHGHESAQEAVLKLSGSAPG